MSVFRKAKPDGEAVKRQSAIELLKHTDGLWRLSEAERMAMTISCHDTDYIEKVKDAGDVKKVNGIEVQVMHNGLLVERGGYHGTWMADIITTLKGHHEPQEEKAFYEVLSRLDPGSTMIELGSFWSYYSIWFNKSIKNARNLGCEPDPKNLALGTRNTKLNNADVKFIRSAAGSNDGAEVDVVMESTNLPEKVTVRSVDSLMNELKWPKLDLLHMDVQGFELSTLEGALKTIAAKKLRFVFVSTHHYLFSDDPNTHARCLDFIKSHGGNIVASHSVLESFSGDGLIVASFSDQDKNFRIEMSLNHSDQSLFRPYEEDLAILAKAYDQI